jgi:acyl-coenzyme A thioesterase PaaI-like protein
MANHSSPQPPAVTASPAAGPQQLDALRAASHPFCLVCSQSNPLGFGLEFVCHPDGSVSATFLGHSALEGYPGWMHGGAIAALLDGAMTNCLFAHGCAAVTGELCVRYRAPVEIGAEVRLRAWMEHAFGRLRAVRSELRQNDCVKATATAKFMTRHE